MRCLTLILLLLSSTHVFANTTLVLIGGGDRPREALRLFLSEALPGPVVVMPWGTAYPDESFESIKADLTALGASDIRCLCGSDTDVSLIAKAGALYFPGGDQNDIMTHIQQFLLKPLLQQRFLAGIPVAGTSAGTAMQTDPMLTGNGSETAEGLGLLTGFIVDQHFIVRQREPRLLEALERYPQLAGIGIDEDMSAVIRNGKSVEAVGPSKVILYRRGNGGIQKQTLNDGEVSSLEMGAP